MNEIKLRYDLQSGRKILPANTRLKVIHHNSTGVRAVDDEGDIHVIRPGDFDPLESFGQNMVKEAKVLNFEKALSR